ncbi:hypothetical protein ACHAQA_007283 [Verticillium albo-atrum]
MASPRLTIATAHRCCRLCRPPSQQQLRSVADLSAARSPATASGASSSATTTSADPTTPQIHRLASTAQTRRENGLPKRYFDPSNGVPGEGPPDPQGKPPDENNVNLGRTLRILQDRLPTLLQYPLDQDILAPNISLHLFPSTHPHLPVVSGRVAYTAALWTSPIAWNRIPVIGNVRLEVHTARMTRHPIPGAAPPRPGCRDDQLVVRWSTCPAPGREGDGPRALEVGKGEKKEEHFSGLFIFQFDQKGRILSHTIETVQGGGDWERGVGAKVVGLTDWLLGGLGRGEPCPAFQATPSGRDDGDGGRGGRN